MMRFSGIRPSACQPPPPPPPSLSFSHRPAFLCIWTAAWPSLKELSWNSSGTNHRRRSSLSKKENRPSVSRIAVQKRSSKPPWLCATCLLIYGQTNTNSAKTNSRPRGWLRAGLEVEVVGMGVGRGGGSSTEVHWPSSRPQEEWTEAYSGCGCVGPWRGLPV